MARRVRDGKPEIPDTGPLALGAHRIGVAWLGLACLALGLAMMSLALWDFVGDGPWPILVIWPVGAVLALPLLVTRVVRVAPGLVRVERRLLGLAWEQQLAAERFRAVVVEGRYLNRGRFSRGQPGSPERLATGMLYGVRLDGRPRVRLPTEGVAVDAVEALARRVGAVLALPTERRGYRRRPDGLAAPVRGAAPERF